MIQTNCKKRKPASKALSTFTIALLLLISTVSIAAPSGLDKNGHLQTLTNKSNDDFSYTTLKNGIQLHINGITKNVIFYGPSTVRVNANQGSNYWKHPSIVVTDTPERVSFKIKKHKDTITLISKKMKVQIDKKTGSLTFMDLDDKVFTRENAQTPVEIKQVEISGSPTYEVTQHFTLKDRESLYGLGQYNKMFWDYRGQEVYMAQSNIGICIPFLISTERYGIMWDIYSKSIFKDGPQGMSLYADSAPGGCDYYFFAGQTMDDVIIAYRNLTGAAPMFSKKSFGLWMSKERYRTQEHIIDVTRKFREDKFPIDNIVQDWQYWGGVKNGMWDGKWSGMIWNPERFPNPAEMARTLHDDLNVQLMCSIWPAIGNNTELAKELDQHGLRHEPIFGISKKARIYDAYSEKGRQIYFKHTKKGLLDVGVDGLWMDGTEVEVAGCGSEQHTEASIKGLGNNEMGDYSRYLNTYSLMTTKGVYEGQRDTGNKRVFTLTRSAFTGQQRYAALSWSGDTKASYKVLTEQIAGGLNVCMAGQPYWTQDIGAFYVDSKWRSGTTPNRAFNELFTRWNQFGIFNPVYRIHGTNIDREPYLFKESDPETYDALLDAANLRYRLMPYIYGLAWQSTKNGYTMMRGMAMDFPDDQNVRKLNTQFMFGPAFLARVVDRNIYRTQSATPKELVPAELLQTPDGKSGVAVQYFNGRNFEQEACKTIETQVNNNWPGPPLTVLPKGLKGVNNFSTRWNAVLTIPETGAYEIGTIADDGSRLWLDGELVVDDWKSHPMTYHGKKLNYTKGQKVNVKIEYFQGKEGRGLQLVWKTPDAFAKEGAADIDNKVTTYLPEGTWYDFWTNEKIQGKREVKKACPLDTFPLYVRQGSIVPMGPKVQHVDEKPDAPYQIRIYPGSDAEFVIYEDDNVTYNYEKGQYVEIPITWNEKKQELRIGKRKGKFPGMIKERDFQIVLISPENGFGIEPAKSFDKTITYKGKTVKVRF